MMPRTIVAPHPRRRTAPLLVAVWTAVLALVVAGCGDAVAPSSGLARECSAPGTAPAPSAGVTVQYATNFALEQRDGFSVLTVKQPFPGGKPERTVLVPCGTAAPALTGDLADAQVIETPVRTVYSGSTTQIPWFTELKVLDALTGAADTSMISNQAARARVSSGAVTQYATGGTIDVERVLAAKPDVLLTDGTENAAYGPLRAAGIPVIGVADWLETSPLAVAEWIKVLGVLTGRGAQAQEVFGRVADSYNALATKTVTLPKTPLLYGADFQGTWSVPGADGPTATLLRDAGGQTPWHDRPGTAVQLSFEDVVNQAGSIGTWLVADNQWRTIADVERVDPRYRSLAAVRDGQVWNANLAMGPTGGNDFYESGSSRPDLVLADTVAILHPEVLPDHQFVYYRRLTR
jgi:iron complex transport system substrate-binding protein